MAELELNPELDIESLANEYARDKKVRIRNVLAPESAERLAACLETETPYRVVMVNAEGQPVMIDTPQIPWGSPEVRATVQRAQNEFSFLYQAYPMYEAYKEDRHPDHMLHRAVAFMNSAPVINLFRTVTGHADIEFTDAQAARYEPGCFLKTHTDRVVGHRRRAAYVLGFTRRWSIDWGGLLIFMNKQGQITHGDKPGFNTLDIFSTPRDHAVTQVARFAGAPRQSITGWARASLEASD